MGGIFDDIIGVFAKKPEVKPKPKKVVADLPSQEERKVKFTEVEEEKAGGSGTFIHIINLYAFKVAVGNTWPKLREKAGMIASGVISKHMQGYSFSQQGDENFVLVFRDIPREEAKTRALVITDDVGQRLIGGQFEISGAKLVFGAEVDPNQAFDADGKLNMDALSQAVDLAVKAALNAQAAVDEPKQDASIIKIPDGLKILFMPCWNLNSQIVNTSILIPAVGNIFGEQLFATLPNIETLLELDYIMANTAVKILEKIEYGSTIILPLHYASLCKGEGEAVLKILREAGDTYKSSLVIEIISHGEGIGPNRLAAAVRPLKTWAREVILRENISNNVELFQNTGITGIGADLGAPENEGIEEYALQDMITGFASRVHRLWLNTYFWGVKNRPQIIAAAEGKAVWINSLGLMKPMSSPVKPTPFPKSRLGL